MLKILLLTKILQNKMHVFNYPKLWFCVRGKG